MRIAYENIIIEFHVLSIGRKKHFLHEREKEKRTKEKRREKGTQLFAVNQYGYIG